MKFGRRKELSKVINPTHSTDFGEGEGAERSQIYYYPETEERLRSQNEKRIILTNFLIFSTWMRVVYTLIICIIVGFVVPLILNQVLVYAPPSHVVSGTCHIELGVRTDCFPEVDENITEAMCLGRGCCYQELNLESNASVCHHKIPSSHILNVTSEVDGLVSLRDAYTQVAWPDRKILRPAIQARQVGEGHVAVLFFDEASPPDLGLGDVSQITDFDLRYQSNLEAEDARLKFQLSREGHFLLDLSYGSVILGETYSEVSVLLPLPLLFGLGGHPFSFESGAVFQAQTLYNIEKKKFHSHPFFMGLDAQRNYYGVYVEAETPVTIEILPGLNNQYPLVTFHSMGGFICLHVYSGPLPGDVTRQLATHLGMPKMPPKWAMGYHICGNTGSAADFATTLAALNQFGVPFDSNCIDQSLYGTAFEPAVPLSTINGAVDKLKASGKKLVLNQVPVVASAGTVHTGTHYVIWNGTKEYEGVWNEEAVVLPDFSHPDIQPWWTASFNAMVEELNMNVSGLILSHNSPLFKADQEQFPCDLEELFYVPREVSPLLDEYSACPTAEHFAGSHLQMHNQYPTAHLGAADTGMADPDSYSFSEYSSTRVATHGGLVGSPMHPTWEHMRDSLKETLELSISGNPMVAMHPCGVLGRTPLNTSMVLDQLCLRWYQMASLMPAMISSYENEPMNRLPYQFIGSYRDWIIHAIEQRYKLLPYLYTLAHLASTEGSPIVRPLFYEFPDTIGTLRNSEQFMLGDAILVSPMMDYGVTQLNAFIPYGSWFGLWSGQKMQGTNEWMLLEDNPFQITSHMRAGSIIPQLEDPYFSVDESYAQSNYTLVVTLGQDLGPRAIPLSAQGRLFVDYAQTMIQFEVVGDATSGGSLSINGLQPIEPSLCLGHNSILSSVIIYGMDQMPSAISVSYSQEQIEVSDDPFNPGTALGAAFYDESVGRLQITKIHLNWCDSERLGLEWSFNTPFEHEIV